MTNASNDEGMTKAEMSSDERRAPRFGIRSFGLRHSSLVILLGLIATPAGAHPVPRGEHDRNVTVTWRPDGVFVQYRLEIDEYTLITSVARWIADQPGHT